MDVNEIDLATADRGNTLEAPVVDEAAAAAALAATEEAAAAEALAATAAAKTDEPARDAGGKFAKKEASDDTKTIPKARFDEQVGKERERAEAAERHAAALAEQLRDKGVTVDIEKLVGDVKAIRREQEAALFDGDKEKAAALADKADELNRDIGEAKAAIKAQAAQRNIEVKTEEERVGATITQLEADHPEFDESHELFNADLVDATVAMQNKYIAEERMTPSKALVKAAATVMKLFGAGKTPPATEEPTPAAKGLGAATAAAASGDRKAAQIAKNLETSKKQPGELKALGMDSDKAGTTQVAEEDAAKMTYEEFAAVPETTRARMRGDFL